MIDLRTAAQQALEALDADNSKLWPSDKREAAITALRAALAEPVQEPVAWSYELATTMLEHRYDGWEHLITRYKPNVPEGSIRNLTPLYTAPPQRKPLTEEDIRDLLEAEFLGRDGKRSWDDDLQVFRLAERAHGIT